MMVFPYAAQAKALWEGSKWLILVGALLGSHFYAYQKGKEAVLEDFASQASTAVVETAEKGRQAVVRASTDVRRISELERQNNELQLQLENATRSYCSLTDDELRIYDAIRQGAGG